MPGRPKLQKLEQHIEQLGGDWVILDQIAGGSKMEDVAASVRGFLPEAPEFPSRSYMYVWIKADDERKEAWKEAKEIAAHNILDDIDEDIDEADPVTSADVSYLKLRAQRAEKRAAAFNPETYGEKKDTTEVNLSFGALHLDALRKAGQMPTGEDDSPEEVESAPERGRVQEADYELIEDGS